jgi:CHAT domain-containing protein/Tfp pilus assembly protein PilF
LKIVSFLLLICCCSLLLISVCQPVLKSVQQAREELATANRYFQQALLADEKPGNEAQSEKLNRLALQKFSTLLVSLPPANRDIDSIHFVAASKAGELEHYFENSAKALSRYNEAIALKSRLPLMQDSFLFKPLLFAGILYYNKSSLDSATVYFARAEAIQNKYAVKLQESERLYNNLGALLYESGNYRQAKNYFENAAEVLPVNNPFYKNLLSNYRINLATILFKLEDYDGANRIYTELLPSGEHRDEIYNNLGLIELNLGATRKAISYFRKVKYSNYLQVGLANDLANAFLQQGNLDSARHYLQLASAYDMLFNKGTPSIDHGETLKLQADLETATGNYAQALNAYQQGIHQFYHSWNNSSVYTNPTSYSGAFAYINLFHLLVAKAEAWHLWYRHSNDVRFAAEELKTYQSAFALLDYVENTYDSDEARLFIGKIKYAVHARPIDVAYELFQRTKENKYLEQLYYIDQQNKASVLAYNQHFSAMALPLHSPLLKKEAELKKEITIKALKAAQTRDSIQLVATNASIRNLEIELGKVRESLSWSVGVPVNTIPAVGGLQDDILDAETALVSFHLSENKITRLVITKHTFEVYQDSLSPRFHEQLQHFILDLRSPSTTNWKQDSKEIYSVLFQHVQINNIKRLIIIPDDELNYLPFESLVNSQGHYLIEKFAIQYQYATSLLKKETADFEGHQTLAFAPFAHEGSDSFEKLSYSASEVQGLQGIKYFDASAQKAVFLKYVDQYKVVHLATHAVINTNEGNLSYIAFAPGNKNASPLLYEREVYDLSLQHTGLLILSACETGSGNLVKGEGIMSLSRAFTYAGCPDILTSLWNADDFSTAYITNHFHHYIDKGYALDKALQQAKKDYLEDEKVNPRLKEPFYWSHLIFIGNFSPAKTFSYGWLLAGVVVLIIAIWTFYNREKLRMRITGLPAKEAK